VVVQAGVKHRGFDIAAFLEQVVAPTGWLLTTANSRRELARLVENGQRDGGLAQVVQQAGHAGAAVVFARPICLARATIMAHTATECM
jgi:hypothetical protein